MTETKTVSRWTVFVNSAISGYYRYKNEFQIYPLDPSLKGVANLHRPLCIEFCYDPSKIKIDERKPKQIYKFDHENSIVREYLFLLNVFTQYLFYLYDSDQCWFFPLSSEDGLDNIKNLKGYNEHIKSCWGQKSFNGDINSDFISIKENEFSILKLEKIKEEQSDTYFNVYGKRLNSDPVTFPSDINLYLDEYFKFTKEKKNDFLSAVSLFTSGMVLRDNRSHLSLSFASFISSIETLSAFDYKGKSVEKCSECNQERYRVSKKFRDFFEFYIKEDKDLAKYIKRIYSIRSKILHNGQLFLSDIKENQFSDILEIEHMIRLIRISIINWLLKSKDRVV